MTDKLVIDGRWIKDEHGRYRILRGVNMSGNSKLPVSNGYYLNDKFFEHRNVSFVGRPFRLEDAPDHFSRLRTWGLTFVRLVIPWEALEHEGPGIYDHDYIDYLLELFKISDAYGIKFFVDPHQDTWSRFSGGSGAPGWTFEVAGLDITNFKETGAAEFYDFKDDKGKMVWPSNYTKLACATMFTLFWGGNTFAPKAQYENEPIQSFLQRHYINCYAYLAKKLSHSNSVLGFEVMNEPHSGYIGMINLMKNNPMKDLQIACAPTPLQQFALGSGIPQAVDHFIKSYPWPTRKNGKKIINSQKKTCWLPGRECIWKQHGVWGIDSKGEPCILNQNHFTQDAAGNPIDFYEDFYVPFLSKFSDGIHKASPNSFIFFEPIPNEEPPKLSHFEMEWHKSAIYAPHWYDLKSVFYKSFNNMVSHDVQGLSKGKGLLESSYFGPLGAYRNYAGQISNVKKAGLANLGEKPCIIGECGIPMDINERKAFENGDYRMQTKFLDAVISAMEANMLNYVLWNYNPHNSNNFGDHWNGEDFSIFSNSPRKGLSKSSCPDTPPLTEEDRITNASSCSLSTSPFDISDVNMDSTNDEPHAGGRALDAIIRPYARAIAGFPICTSFRVDSKKFELVFGTKSETVKRDEKQCITEIFVPKFHYGTWSDFQVEVSDGVWKYDPLKEMIFWLIDPTIDCLAKPNTKSWFGFTDAEQKLPEDIKSFHFLRISEIKTKKNSWWKSL